MSALRGCIEDEEQVKIRQKKETTTREAGGDPGLCIVGGERRKFLKMGAVYLVKGC